MTEFINVAYLISAVLFIVGLKGMTRPKTAVRGNQLASGGMAVAVAATLLDQQIVSWSGILAGVAIGAAAGVVIARKVEMSQMPELVALFNGLGGLASLLVAFAYVLSPETTTVLEEGGVLRRGMEYEATVALPLPAVGLVAAVVSGLVGAVTFSGSLVAFGKLSGAGWADGMNAAPLGRLGNGVMLAVALLLGLWCVSASSGFAYFLMAAAAIALGVGLVAGTDGADMPVVIALLNSYSGLAAAATGFVLGNSVLIISGALVGASGLILTRIMCRAMNRSLANVLFGGIDASETEWEADGIYAAVQKTSAEEVAMLLEDARRVVIVPGYGMAVAQAQHAVRDLTNAMRSRGTDVTFAIHPVAGRMPGQMNVLLAESDVPYDLLVEMDEANSEIETADVALVVGANDTVNPDARTNPRSPIAGMPIVDVDRARSTVVIKRSLSPGYAGIANPLFAEPNTLMLFADAKAAVNDIKSALEDN